MHIVFTAEFYIELCRKRRSVWYRRVQFERRVSQGRRLIGERKKLAPSASRVILAVAK